MRLDDPNKIKEFLSFRETVLSSSDYAAILKTLEESKVTLPLILCASNDIVLNPDPSREMKAKSYEEAATLILFLEQFFPVENIKPVILDQKRKVIYSR